MSLKSLLPLLCFVLMTGCNSRNQKLPEKFSQLTEVEKDSLTELYHQISKTFYQPSVIHRSFKDTVLMIDPGHVEYRQRLSYSYKKTGEHIKAMELLNEAVAQDIKNGNTAALQYRAWSFLFFYRDYERTIEDVELIQKMQPENKYTICHGEPCDLLKGQALYKLGKYEEAIEVFQALLKVEEEKGWDPSENFHANFYMARCYAELGKFERAIGLYKALISENDKLTEVYYQLGRIYNLQGSKEKAKENLKAAQALLSEGYKMGEQYYEAFDEVFEYQIQRELLKTSESPETRA